MKKTNKSGVLLLVLLVLVAVSAMYVASTYAKYTAEVTGSGTTTVAKWAFDTENATQDISIVLNGTVDASTLIADRIAQGTSGNFAIELSNKQSEVGVEFTIEFTGTENVPSNLVFKQNGNVVDPTNGDTITGKIAQNGTLSVPLTWEWPYYTSATDDGEDTTDGKAGKQMTLNVKITGVQTQPGAAITTGINN